MERGFCSDAWVMLRGGDLGALGVPRGSFISNIVMQHMVKGQTGGIVMKSKGHISLHFHYKANFKDIYTKLCVCSHKIYIAYRMKCSFCRLGHAPGVGLGGAVVKNLNVGICDGAPSTVRSSCRLFWLIWASSQENHH